MTVLHFIFTPMLNCWMKDLGIENDNPDNKELSFPTSNEELNKIVTANLLIDKTDIKNIMYGLKPLSYKYDIDTNLIHIWVGKDIITDYELAEYLYNYDPDGYGPDSWMEGPIEIVTDEQAQQFGYVAIEMIPMLNSIYIEYQVDIQKLPCVSYGCKSKCEI